MVSIPEIKSNPAPPFFTFLINPHTLILMCRKLRYNYRRISYGYARNNYCNTFARKEFNINRRLLYSFDQALSISSHLACTIPLAIHCPTILLESTSSGQNKPPCEPFSWSMIVIQRSTKGPRKKVIGTQLVHGSMIPAPHEHGVLSGRMPSVCLRQAGHKNL